MFGTKAPPVIAKKANNAPAAAAAGKPAKAADWPMGQGRPGFPVLGLGLIAGASAAGLYFSTQSNYLLGQVAAVVIGGFGLHGLWRGGFRKMIMLPLTVGMLY